MRRYLLHITLSFSLLTWQSSTLFAEPSQTEAHINRVYLLSAHLYPVALNHSKDGNLLILAVRPILRHCKNTKLASPELIEMSPSGAIVKRQGFPNLIVEQYTHRVYRTSGGFVFTGWVGLAEKNSSNLDECSPSSLERAIALRLDGWESLFPPLEGMLRQVVPLDDLGEQFYVGLQLRNGHRLIKLDHETGIEWSLDTKEPVRAAALGEDQSLLVVQSIWGGGLRVRRIATNGIQLSNRPYPLQVGVNPILVPQAGRLFLLFGRTNLTNVYALSEKEATLFGQIPFRVARADPPYWFGGLFHDHSIAGHIDSTGKIHTLRLDLGVRSDRVTDVLPLQNRLFALLGTYYEAGRGVRPYFTVTTADGMNACLGDAQKLKALERAVQGQRQIYIRHPRRPPTNDGRRKPGLAATPFDLPPDCYNQDAMHEYQSVLESLAEHIPPREYSMRIEVQLSTEPDLIWDYTVGNYTLHSCVNPRLTLGISDKTAKSVANYIKEVIDPHFALVDSAAAKLMQLLRLGRITPLATDSHEPHGTFQSNDPALMRALEDTMLSLTDTANALTPDQVAGIRSIASSIAISVYPDRFKVRYHIKDQAVNETLFTATEVFGLLLRQVK
ncbi:MAG: hypothetical protein KUG75_09130 [Pseudomonadales bacterium]|nr:hypothetical protein [Pseudomonadales bacterium]